jgi:hypothetical protein
VVARSPLVVQDAAENAFFKDNVFVRRHRFRFYAGVPIFGRLGEAVGTLCLIDHQPRRFTRFDLELLHVLARRVAGEFEHRDRIGRPLAPASSFNHLADWDPELNLLGRCAFSDALVVESIRAIQSGAPLAVAVAVVDPQDLSRVVAALAGTFPRAHLGRLALGRIGLALPGIRAADVHATLEGCVASCRIEARDVPPQPGAGPGALQALEDALGDGGLIPRRVPD